jgi:hypothetical protein
MRKLLAPASLFGFLYINMAIGVFAWQVTTLNTPFILCFFESLILFCGLPFVVLFLCRWLGFDFPPGLLKLFQHESVKVFMAVLFVTGFAARDLVRFTRGKIYRHISVTEAAALPDATGFEFRDGRGRALFAGAYRPNDSTEPWTAIPLVPDTWTPDDPITAWALHRGAVPMEVVDGTFRSGLVWDERDPNFEDGQKAVLDAVTRHGLKSDPHAVILEMGQSLEHLKAALLWHATFWVALINAVWLIAVLIVQHPETRAVVSAGTEAS